MSISELQAILHSFKIQATVVDQFIGTSIITYEIKLHTGVREATLRKFLPDIGRELRAPSLPRLTTIYERGTCRLEVPKQNKNIVKIREVFESFEYINSDSPLTFGVGKDVNGNIVVGDLKQMPHLLIAGATGTGKSVFLNSLTISILKKSSPDRVRFLMIDPKVVELMTYNDVPHMMYPVITDTKKAIGALEWAVMEMERRYREYEKNNKHYGLRIKNIDDFNRHMKDESHRPHIVIIIDEYADLMIADKDGAKMLEKYIQRLGQKARAAGIHLILATQRPDKTVVTGIIKSNIPSRIAFAVADATNSRIILDEKGAESLNGRGDMIYSPAGANESIRAQAPYVSDDEMGRFIDHLIKNYGKAVYDKEAIDMIDGKGINKSCGFNPYVPLTDDVKKKMGWSDNSGSREDERFHEMYILDQITSEIAMESLLDERDKAMDELDKIEEKHNEMNGVEAGYEDLVHEGFTVDEIAVMDDEELEDESENI